MSGSALRIDKGRMTRKKLRIVLAVSALVILVLLLTDDHMLGFFTELSLKFQSAEHQQIVAHMRQYKWFVTALIKNNENILPNWCNQLEKFIRIVGPELVYVSVVENGDSVDNSAYYLKRFKRRLDAMQVPNNFSLEHKVITAGRPRINYLADMRNQALEPLYPLASKANWRILFLNDIVFTVNDLIELAGTNNMEYDFACALDFGVIFYDQSVSRDLDGRWLLNFYPFFRDRVARKQMDARKPVRVFACWNGVAVMRPEPFMIPSKTSQPSSLTRFRNRWPHGDSECFLICKDFFLRGYDLILINPKVKVTYLFSAYFLHQVLPWNQFMVAELWHRLSGYVTEGNPLSAALTHDVEILSTRNWTAIF